MQRRRFLKWSSLLSFAGLAPIHQVVAGKETNHPDAAQGRGNDRSYWVALLDKIATPVLNNMSKGELRKNMKVVYSPIYDDRNKEVAYMEAFGRLIAGLAPFLALPDDSSEEGAIRKRLRLQTQQSLANAANPASPDYLFWGSAKTIQPLVDAAYIAQALLYAPKALWEPLDASTKNQLITAFKSMRQWKPWNNNWLLFAAMIETFLLSIGEEINTGRIDEAIDQMNKWYIGDGWYSDGEKFHFDHYNGYVIHPMLVEILRVNAAKGRRDKKEFDLAYLRMQRYASFQERYISPEGTYIVIGRSSTYRAGAFWPLVKTTLDNQLPEDIQPAQVRAALTAVLKNLFIPSTFTKEGWLTLGLVGDKQEAIADYYSNTGSMYITSLVFLPLGLPASHEFWAAPAADWTQKKAWSGQPFKKDYAVKY